MKKHLIITVLLLSANSLFSQNYYSKGSNIEKYKDSVIKQQFSKTFDTEEKKEKFKDLREFLAEKEDVYNSLNYALPYYNNEFSKYIKAIDFKINKFKNIQSKLKPETTFKLSGYDVEIPGGFLLDQNFGAPAEVRNFSEMRDYNKEGIADLIETFENTKKEFKDKNVIAERLQLNIENVKQDINDCRRQIDATLAPEYKKQSFATYISICFTVIIAILLISFFLIVYLRSDNSLSKDLLSGYGLQFITLFVLIIAIILFGILGILQSSELAAILSGISGYILGKGIQDKKTVDLNQLSGSLTSNNANQTN